MERFDLGLWALVKSAAIASVLSQAVGLILLGLMQDKGSAGDRLGAILALPMTLVFFAVPAFLWTIGIVLASYYGSRAIGFVWATPYLVGLIGFIWGAVLFIRNPEATGAAMPGYAQALAMVIAWTLIVWGIYAHFRFFAGENHG